MEVAVLVGLMDEFATESYSNNFEKWNEFETWASTSIENASIQTGLTKKQVAGYVTQLKQKGYITGNFNINLNSRDESVLTFTAKVLDVIEYEGRYSWKFKTKLFKELIANDIAQR
jgi:ribosomal protein S17E